MERGEFAGVHLVFVTNLDERNASYRFRIQKLVPHFEQAGLAVSVFHYRVRAEALFTVPFYLLLKRKAHMQQVVVFQRRETFALARVARAVGVTVLVDIDDGGNQNIDGTPLAESERRSLQSWMESVDGVIASCANLAEWIRPWNSNLHIVPTCVDADHYADLGERRQEPVTIGWVGGPSCQVVLETVDATLATLTRQTGAAFLVVGPDRPLLDPRLDFEFMTWDLSLEPSIYGRFHIGINPMPENERTRMKAGFKMLQYMAAGLPVVSSPVGVNKELIQHGENGFLATTPQEWEEYLRRLIHDPTLREKIGQSARDTVLQSYTLHHAACQWLRSLAQIQQSPILK